MEKAQAQILECLRRLRRRSSTKTTSKNNIHIHSCHILPFQPILWKRYCPPEPANTARRSPKSISEGVRIWQVWKEQRGIVADFHLFSIHFIIVLLVCLYYMIYRMIWLIWVCCFRRLSRAWSRPKGQNSAPAKRVPRPLRVPSLSIHIYIYIYIHTFSPAVLGCVFIVKFSKVGFPGGLGTH